MAQADISLGDDYNLIQDWDCAGLGSFSCPVPNNSGGDPKFSDPDGPDDIVSTFEDNDYRLVNPGMVGAVSPAIDSGDPSITLISPQYFPPDTFDVDGLDGTSEPTPDLNLTPAKRVIASLSMDAIINRGAYEELCTPAGGCLGDIVDSDTFDPPGDGYVSGADLAQLLIDWCTTATPGCCIDCLGDLVTSATFLPPPDTIVDGADLAVLLGAWGNCPCAATESMSMMMMGGGSESESSEEESSPSYDNPFYGTYLGMLLDEVTATNDSDSAAEALAELLDVLNNE